MQPELPPGSSSEASSELISLIVMVKPTNSSVTLYENAHKDADVVLKQTLCRWTLARRVWTTETLPRSRSPLVLALQQFVELRKDGHAHVQLPQRSGTAAQHLVLYVHKGQQPANNWRSNSSKWNLEDRCNQINNKNFSVIGNRTDWK